MMQIHFKASASMVAVAVACTSMLTAAPALAGNDDTAAAAAGFGDILVTARKRSEDLLKTPVAISAFDTEALEKKSLATVTDIAASTPGMNVNSNNTGRNDRSFQQIIIRGFVPQNAQNPTTSTFINGVPVSSATAFNSVTDPERIEIMRGPQSAYFGRGTFAGAMNVIPKEPGEELSGSITGMVGTRGNYRIAATIETPVLGDALGFRISASQSEKNGSYKNAFSGGNLGEQKTRNVSGLIVAKPLEGLKIKAFGLYSEDRDGHHATGLISPYTVYDTAGNLLLQGQANCTLPSGRPFMCGTVRNLSAAPSANQHVDAQTAAFLANPNRRLTAPGELIDDYGLGRNFYHVNLSVDYEIGDTGLTISSLTGTNRERYAQIANMDLYGSILIPNTAANITAGAPTYYNSNGFVERVNSDFSQEIRLGFDNGGPLILAAGASYLHNWTQGSNAAGFGVLSINTAGISRSRTRGIFGSVSYKFTDQFTVNFDARYQADTLAAYAGPNGVNITNDILTEPGFYSYGEMVARATFKNFLPRIIAQYEFGPEAMVYASWAKGVNPAQFNTAFLSQPAYALDYAANVIGMRIKVEPEEVTNYEVGVKGRLLDGNLNYSLAAYFAKWRKQANLLTPIIPELDEYGEPTGNTLQFNGQANAGTVDMRGLELEVNWRANDLMTFGFSGALNDSEIVTHSSPLITGYTGISDFKGNEMPNFSKWSATANVEFRGDIRGFDDATWFARADYNYKSGLWNDVSNIVRTPDIHKVNLRAGISRGPVSIDAFVTNLFNNKTFTSIGDHYTYIPGTYPAQTVVNGTTVTTTVPSGISGLAVGLPELRTVGLQVRYKF